MAAKTGLTPDWHFRHNSMYTFFLKSISGLISIYSMKFPLWITGLWPEHQGFICLLTLSSSLIRVMTLSPVIFAHFPLKSLTWPWEHISIRPCFHPLLPPIVFVTVVNGWRAGCIDWKGGWPLAIRTTHCPDCRSFSLTTAQLVRDSSSVGQRAACMD